MAAGALPLQAGNFAPDYSDIIPADRRIDWSKAGIPGGKPTNRPNCTTDACNTLYSGAVTAATINAAIGSAPADTVVRIPAGNFTVASVDLAKNGITLRGAGVGKTNILMTGQITIGHGSGCFGAVYSGQTSIFNLQQSGMQKGSTNITLDRTSGIQSGDGLLIDQINDGDLVASTGEGANGRENATRLLGQIVEVSSVSANNVTIDTPLYATFSSSLLPQAIHLPSSIITKWSGIEDMTISGKNTSSQYIVYFTGVFYCWLENVEVNEVNVRGVRLGFAHHSQIRNCYIHDALGQCGSSYGYGIYVDEHTTESLVENNILEDLDGGFIMLGEGASGNVTSYNYMNKTCYTIDKGHLASSPNLNHGAHPYMNLLEGNVGFKSTSDGIHGTGSHQTLFRIRSKGWESSEWPSATYAITFEAGTDI